MKRLTLAATAAFSAVYSAVNASGTEPVKTFTPDWEWLKTNRCPDWFRDANFGIWPHWGPQAVPIDGDDLKPVVKP